MADKIFSYAPINPIRAAQVKTFDPRYNNKPFDYQVTQECYIQPWKTSDHTTIQVLTDFVPVMKWYEAYTGIYQFDTPFTVIPNTILGKTYQAYEAQLVFSDFPIGKYYFEITYNETPDNGTLGGTLFEPTGPDYVDINLNVKYNGDLVNPALTSTGSFLPVSKSAGGTYSFQAFCESAPTAAQPKANMVITKDGVIIFSGNMPCTPGESLLYEGILQPEANYVGKVVGCNGCPDIPEINISDNSPVDPGTVELWQSDIIDIQEEQENTILFEYTNSENDFSSIFDTGTVFNLRVEGSISLPKPEFNNVVYNDINHNSTKLYGDPWTSFTLFVAYSRGVAPWMVDRVNRIMACDQIKIDGVYYEMEDGSKWEEQRADLYELYGANITIKEVQNRFLESLILGPNTANNDSIIVYKSLVYSNQATDLTISGIFKDKSLLDRITFNIKGIYFTLKIGTTPGGSEIYEQELTADDLGVNGLVTPFVNYAFKEPTTVYISGWTAGVINDVSVGYIQYDAPPISGSVNPYKQMGRGAVVIYDPPAGQDLSVDFNLGTGLGMPDTDWFGWAIMDGRNGTTDLGGETVRGYLATFTDGDGNVISDYNVPGTEGGSDSHIQTVNEMPSHSHTFDKNIVLGRSDNARDIDAYTSGWEGSTNTLIVQNTGGGQAMDWRNKYKVVLWVKKIND